MKYIISESRLNKIMTEYINTYFEDKTIIEDDEYILVFEANDPRLRLEYNVLEKSLYISRNLIQHLRDMFSINRNQSATLLSDWFKNKFYVKVSFHLF